MIKTLLTVSCFMAATFAATAQTNLVQNGGFEEWADGTPAHWQKTEKGSPSNGTVKEFADGRSGKALEVEHKGGKKPGNARFHCESIALKAGNYKLSFFAKAESEAVVDGGWHIEGATGVKGYTYSGKPLTVDNNEWKEFTYTFTLDSDANVDVFVVNKKDSKGAAYFDDMTLTAEGSTPAPTPGPTPTPETPVGGTVYEKALTDNADGWTFEQGTLPEGQTAIWAQGNKYGMKASGHFGGKTGANYDTEAWVISPELNLEKKASLTFEHALNFKADASTQGVYVRENGGAWTELTVPTWPAGKDWKYVNSGEISLEAYKGKKVQIGFKYTSTTEGAATWEFKNFKVTEAPEAVRAAKVRNARTAIFDLSGRRVEKAENGIFIINGVKTVVR